jgi:hypothetical protein
VKFAFDHVHVLCDDVATVGTFLHEVIGATELRRNETIRNWELELDGVRIFVRQRRDDEPLAGVGIRRAGADHLGFTVLDIDAAIAELAAAGCTLAEARRQVRADLATAFLMAPGGLLIELLQRG